MDIVRESFGLTISECLNFASGDDTPSNDLDSENERKRLLSNNSLALAERSRPVDWGLIKIDFTWGLISEELRERNSWKSSLTPSSWCSNDEFARFNVSAELLR